MISLRLVVDFVLDLSTTGLRYSKNNCQGERNVESIVLYREQAWS